VLAFRLHLADRERLRCGDSCACRTSGARGNLGSFPRPLRAGLSYAAPPALVFVLGDGCLLIRAREAEVAKADCSVLFPSLVGVSGITIFQTMF